jgi:lipopolysaccharide transport system ATP-binding protein
MTTVISVENLSKIYRLGQIGTGTFANDLKLWWAKARGKPNPLLKIGETDHGNLNGENLWALRDVSFTVEQGEVLGIIGRNGAGKSTLLKILSCVTAPTSGKIKVKGRIASLLEVGTGFHPELTGRENTYLNGAILGMTRNDVERKFDEIVGFAEIEKFIDTPVKRYSSGMYVRLAFAVAAHLDPEILIIDEVLAVGDVDFQKRCLGKMKDIASGGRTVLFVSHNMAAIKQLCTRTLLVENGGIALSGSTISIVDAYLKKSQKNRRKYQTSSHEYNIRIEGVLLLNPKDQEIDKFASGEFFKIRYLIMNEHGPTKVALGISVEDSNTARLFASYSGKEGKYFPLARGMNVIDFCVPELPLNEGTFYVTAAVHLATSKNTCIDRIDQARYFEVYAPLYREQGTFIDNTFGPVFAQHEWVYGESG